MVDRIRHPLDIIVTLAQKDFKIRYRNSALGFLWSLLNPLAYMVILTVVFSLLLPLGTHRFASSVLIGLLVWRFFAIGTNQGLLSIVGNPSLVTKVYVPRYLIVLSNNLANFLGASLEFLILLPLLVLLGVNLTVYALLLPVVLILEFLLVFGLSLSLSTLNVRYRDFYQLWEIALGLGFFLSPIVYEANLIPTRFRLLYSLNPVTCLIESTRTIFLWQQLPSSLDYAVMTFSAATFLVIGLLIFCRFESKFAEEL